MSDKKPIGPKKNPINAIKRAQDIKQSVESKEAVKESLVSAIKTQIAHMSAHTLPYVAVAAILVFVVLFAIVSLQRTIEIFSVGSGNGCMTQESVVAAKDGLSKIPDNAEYEANLEKLNNKLSEVGFCNGYSPLPEGISGGVYYNQLDLNDTIKGIRSYLKGKSSVPSLDDLISEVKNNIQSNSESELSEAEKTKKAAKVQKQLKVLYASEKTSAKKWEAIALYLEEERGATLWKADVGKSIVAAASAKIGLPYVFGGRTGWTGSCYELGGLCGFDCSALAGYAAAVGNGKSTAVKKEGANGRVLAAGYPYRGTVSSLVVPADSGEWSYISPSEIAPGDFVILPNNDHVAVFSGQNDKGVNMYIEAPRPGSFVIQRKAWWGGYNLRYIRPYDTIKF